jgi:carbon monoxide dehydrogenase subunit G
MASIQREILINAEPAVVWEAVRDVGSVHKRLVPGVLVDAVLDGDARVVTFANGLVVRELIVDIDDDERRFAYAVVDGPFTHHNASMHVAAGANGCTRLTWITDLLPNELVPAIGDLIEEGAAAMQRTLEH